MSMEDDDAPDVGPVENSDRTWGILAHASAFAGMIFPVGGNIIAPLLIWLIKKEESEFVAENGRNAVNFQITWTIYGIIVGFTLLVAIGFILLPILMLAWLILVIIATVRTSNEEVYAYPLTIEFIK